MARRMRASHAARRCSAATSRSRVTAACRLARAVRPVFRADPDPVLALPTDRTRPANPGPMLEPTAARPRNRRTTTVAETLSKSMLILLWLEFPESLAGSREPQRGRGIAPPSQWVCPRAVRLVAGVPSQGAGVTPGGVGAVSPMCCGWLVLSCGWGSPPGGVGLGRAWLAVPGADSRGRSWPALVGLEGWRIPRSCGVASRCRPPVRMGFRPATAWPAGWGTPSPPVLSRVGCKSSRVFVGRVLGRRACQPWPCQRSVSGDVSSPRPSSGLPCPGVVSPRGALPLREPLTVRHRKDRISSFILISSMISGGYGLTDSTPEGILPWG